jgi:hypothetical protein
LARRDSQLAHRTEATGAGAFASWRVPAQRSAPGARSRTLANSGIETDPYNSATIRPDARSRKPANSGINTDLSIRPDARSRKPANSGINTDACRHQQQPINLSKTHRAL